MDQFPGGRPLDKIKTIFDNSLEFKKELDANVPQIKRNIFSLLNGIEN